MQFTLAIDFPLAVCSLTFSNCDFWHYFVPVRRNDLTAMAQGLRDPLGAGVLGQAVTAIFRTIDFVYCYAPLGDLVLNPQFAEFDVSDFS